MSEKRKLSRRSFVSVVTGGAVVGPLGLVGGAIPARAQGCSDTDPRPQGDPGGQGRRCGSNSQTGCSDPDRGPRADRGGQGRNCSSRGVVTRCSDSDSGQRADPGGGGQVCGSNRVGFECAHCGCGGYIEPASYIYRLGPCARATCGHPYNRHSGGRVVE